MHGEGWQRAGRAARSRRTAAALLGAVVGLGLGTWGAATAADPGIRIAAVDTTVDSTRGVQVTLRCTGAEVCRGTAGLSAPAPGTPTVGYRIEAGGSKTITLRLTPQIAQRLRAERTLAAVLTLEASKPTPTTLTKDLTLRAAATRVRLESTEAMVEHDLSVGIDLTCTAVSPCTGTVQPIVGGLEGDRVAFEIDPHAGATTTLHLTEDQAATLTETPTPQTLRIRQTLPKRVSSSPTILLGHDMDSDPVYSEAYLNRNWTPTAYDTCSAALHASYQVRGPDGKIYPGWHPPRVVDPETGLTCTFGHDHGDDPRTSDIYPWVAAWFDNGQEADDQGIAFGYVSEILMDYAHDHDGTAMRHEDNVGHKVIVENNVRLLDADRNWVLDADGAKVTCDYLIKAHQGSHSGDATANNAHELIYATRCTDGTAIIASTLSRFGDANEFNRGCAPGVVVATVGSDLPAGDGGRRLIPDKTCVDTYAIGASASLWGVYEVWESANALRTEDGTVVATYDPWFGVRNPSRYYDPTTSTATTNGIARTLDKAWGTDAATGYPWNTVNDLEPFDYRDPRSPFDGAQRDFYLGTSQVDPAYAGTLYTDPYGGHASSEPFTGAIAQYVHPGTATWGVALTRQKFDNSTDFGNGNGVHAPN